MIYLLFIFFIIVELKFVKALPGVNYYDEILTIIAIFMLLKCHKKMRECRIENRILIYISIVLLIGSVSTYVYHYQPSFSGVWRDFLAMLKFPLCYVSFFVFYSNKNKDSFFKVTVPISRIAVSIIAIFAIINVFLKSPFLGSGFRYGFPLYSFFYAHATYLISVLIFLLSVLISNGIQKNKLYILLGVLATILTLRSKPIITIVFILFVLLFKDKLNIGRISKLKTLLSFLIVISMGVYFSRTQINAYIEYSDMAARGAFYIRGIDVANDHFPLGSGFCTFASSLAHKYYSPLYYKYNMQNIWGMTEDDGSYASDTYWPYIYAECGYIGLLFYLFMFVCLFKSVNKRFKVMTDKWVAAICLLLYALTASFAEAFLTNDTTVLFAVALAIFIGSDNKRINNEDIRNS